jgi:hypothetical protein
MTEANVQRSRDDLFNFLDFAGEKGLLRKTTASARRDASKIILGILDDDEAADLSKVDLENVIRRYRNLATGKIMPKTLAAYESRTRTAVKDFLQYLKNPSAWKPSTRQRATRVAAAAPSAKRTSKPKGLAEPQTTDQPSVHIDFQIHISPEASPEQIDQIFASMRRHLYGSIAGK